MKSWGWVGGVLLAVACGQELELPVPSAAPEEESGGPTSGITGMAGAADEEAAPARLPVTDKPLFGEAGTGGVAEGGAAGAGGGDADGEGGRMNPLSEGGAAGEGSAAGGGTTGGGGSAAGGRAGSGGGGGSPTQGKPPALLFTEYVEGSGSLKALEIYALSASSLEGCELETYFNGKLVPGKLALHGELAAGQMQVLCSSALATAQPKLCSRSTNLTFNGDDALALTCGGKTLDVIGQLGVDPGESWGKGATADHTLRRRCEVKLGRSDGKSPFDPALDWTSFAVDTFADLGLRACK